MNRLILFLAIVLVPSLGFAQQKWTIKDRWRNSFGASFHLLHVGENVSPAFGVYYNPQINIVNKFSDFSFAYTMPISLGVHIKDSWIDKTFFYSQIPAVMEVNFGHYSTRDFRSKIGMGFGAGYGVQIAGSDIGSGVVGTVAARTWFFKGSLTIRYLFMANIQGSGYHAHSLVIAVNMGNYFHKLRHMNKISKFHNFK